MPLSEPKQRLLDGLFQNGVTPENADAVIVHLETKQSSSITTAMQSIRGTVDIILSRGEQLPDSPSPSIEVLIEFSRTAGIGPIIHAVKELSAAVDSYNIEKETNVATRPVPFWRRLFRLA